VLGGVAQIVAGRERLVARAGQDADPHLGIALEIAPDLVQLEVRRRMERVHPLRAIDGDDRDAALLLVGRELVGHDVSPLGGARECPSPGRWYPMRGDRVSPADALTVPRRTATFPPERPTPHREERTPCRRSGASTAAATESPTSPRSRW